MQMVIEETLTSSKGKRSRPASRKYIPEDVLSMIIKGKFTNLQDYKKWVIENNLVERGYPLDPRKTYRSKMPIDVFLGNPIGTHAIYKINRAKELKFWLKSPTHIMHNASNIETPTSPNPKKAVVRAKTISNEDLENTCKFLIDHGMTSTVKNMLSEPKITLKEALIISKIIIEKYEQNISSEKFI